MHETGHATASLVLLIGTVIFVAIVLRWGLERVGLPPLVGFLLLGVGLRGADLAWHLLPPDSGTVFRFLEGLGLVALLFRVGMESNPRGLLDQLPRASGIWLSNVLCTGLPGYAVAAWGLGLGTVPSLFVAVAMTATSVGVSMAVWDDAGAVDSPTGRLLVDLAELDDISGVLLMTLLFAVVPVLHQQGQLQSLALAETAGWFVLKLLGFVALCAAFSCWMAEPLANALQRIAPAPEAMHPVVGTGLVIASLAGALGFSLAIGALFAGLVYNRLRQDLEQDAFYQTLYQVFAPFFFIGIGLRVEPGALLAGLQMAGILLLVAVAGKVVGTALPALPALGGWAALLMGVSMVPRAEITMIIMQQGEALGSWAVPAELFAAMLVVAMVTCLATPPVIQRMLGRGIPGQE